MDTFLEAWGFQEGLVRVMDTFQEAWSFLEGLERGSTFRAR